MTVKVKDLISRLEVLKDVLKRKDRILREENEAEIDHVNFLERNLACISLTVDTMRAGRVVNFYKLDPKKINSPTSYTGQSTNKNSVNPVMANLTRMLHHKRGNLSGDWQDFSSHRKSNDRLFTSIVENPTTLRNQTSTSTLQKKSKRSNSFLNNLYSTHILRMGTEVSPKRVRKQDKSDSCRITNEMCSLSDQRRKDVLEQSKSMVRFNQQLINIQKDTILNTRDQDIIPIEFNPNLSKIKPTLAQTIQIIGLRKNSETKIFKRTLPDIQTMSNCKEVRDKKGEIVYEFSSRTLPQGKEGFSNETSFTGQVQHLNMKRRETVGEKLISPSNISKKEAYLSPGRQLNKTPAAKTDSENIKRISSGLSTHGWLKNKSRQSKPQSQDLYNSSGSQGLSTSKALNEILNSKNRNNIDVKSIKNSN